MWQKHTANKLYTHIIHSICFQSYDRYVASSKQVLHTVQSRTSSFDSSCKSEIVFRWVTNLFSLVLIWPGHGNDHYPPSTTKVMNWQCYTPAPLICFHGMYRNKCTFLKICYFKNIHYIRSQVVFFSIFSAIFLKNASNEGIYMMKHTSCSIHTFHVWWDVLRHSISLECHVKSMLNCIDKNQIHFVPIRFSANHKY